MNAPTKTPATIVTSAMTMRLATMASRCSADEPLPSALYP
jgi:hypothetical protein